LVAELGDPLDVLRGSRIDFAMAVFFPKEHRAGSPFSVSEAILREGCPPHDGQPAAHTAVAETIWDKKMPPENTVVPSKTPATISSCVNPAT
jgi:hypothetical protein